MTNDSTPAEVAGTRSALLGGIARSWQELQDVVRDLDERRLSAPGPDGWSVKDHLTHLARWEQYLLATIEDRDAVAALGLPADQERTETAVNAALHRLDAGRSPEEAQRLLVEAHVQVLAGLEALDEAGLQHHLAHIEGNTSGHFDEHRAWIAGLLTTQR